MLTWHVWWGNVLNCSGWVRKSTTTQQQTERETAWHSWTDNILHFLCVVIGINNHLGRPLPPNLGLWKFIFNSSKEIKTNYSFLPKKSQPECSLKWLISLVWVKYDLTRLKINLQVKFSGTHLLGKASSARILQWKWQWYVEFF